MSSFYIPTVAEQRAGTSPYPHGVKCYIVKRPNGWNIIGHRWGQVPYHVDTIKYWPAAVKRAQQHVEGGGLRWAPTVR